MRKNKKQTKTNIQVTPILEKALATLKRADTVQVAGKPFDRATLVKKLTPKPFLTLLGDSSIDNDGYVGAGEDVTTLVKAYCPDWDVIKLATDGAIIQSVAHQTGRGFKPWSADRSAVLSVGGNDAVRLIRRMADDQSATFLDAMVDLTTDVMKFSLKYHGLVQDLRGAYANLALCTIYRPNFPDRALNEVATTLLPSFNQVIRDAARAYNCVLIDNFSIIDPAYIVHNIEPGRNASKLIAGAIAAFGRQALPARTGLGVSPAERVAPKTNVSPWAETEETACPKSLPAPAALGGVSLAKKGEPACPKNLPA